jgi:hypothetical protein
MIIFHHDGAETHSKTPSLALKLWFMHCCPRRPITVESHSLPHLIIGEPVKFPTEGQPFIDVCVAYIERSYNKTPVLTGEFDEKCKKLLIWMEGNGVITGLTHDGELSTV